MTLLSTITTLLAAAGGTTTDGFWMPRQASTAAAEVDWIFFFIYWICIFFFTLIVTLMVIFVIKYRRREGVKAEQTASHNMPLELTWTIIPLILVIVIFYFGLRGYASFSIEPANSYEVYVTGQRWIWTFDHRNGAQEPAQLTVPAGRPIKLVMTSTDVLHSFYMPEFRLKKDVVPGRYTYLYFEAAEPGDYQIFCAEYCGKDHSQMAAVLHVLPEEQFQRVIANKANWMQEYGDEELHIAGYRLYLRCKSCHTLDGSPNTGPSFRQTHEMWGQPRALMDGSEVIIDENYVRNSILNPGSQIVSPFANVMNTFQGQLKEREVRALIEFIKRLDEVVDDEGNLRAQTEGPG